MCSFYWILKKIEESVREGANTPFPFNYQSTKMSAIKKAIIGIDWQLCFSQPLGSDGIGALYVPGAEQALAEYNAFRAQHQWDFEALSLDTHPETHVSFAVNHPGEALFSTIQTPLGPQVLWPIHAVEGTTGAQLDPNLEFSIVARKYKKGTKTWVDSYSIVGDATPEKVYERSSIIEDMRAAGIEEVYMGGLAMNYCVAFSAIDLAKAGFRVFVKSSACAAVPDGTLGAQMKEMSLAGVLFI